MGSSARALPAPGPAGPGENVGQSPPRRHRRLRPHGFHNPSKAWLRRWTAYASGVAVITAPVPRGHHARCGQGRKHRLMHNPVSPAYSSLKQVTGAAGKAAGRQAHHLHARRAARPLLRRLHPPGHRRAIRITGHYGPKGRSITPGSGAPARRSPTTLSRPSCWRQRPDRRCLLRRLVVRGGSTLVSAVGGPVGAGEERVAHRCARRDAQRVGEGGGWCLPDEFAPGGQPADTGGMPSR